MRYTVFYQSTDSRIQGIIAIISKNRCSSTGWNVRCFYAFALSKRMEKEINTRRLSLIIRAVSTVLLIINFLQSLF